MPKRPTISAPRFGEWLAAQRGERSLEQIARRLRQYVKAVGLEVAPSLIHKYERGRVPSWPMLAAFAQVFDVPIEDVTQRLLFALEFPGASDLIRHGGSLEQERAQHPRVSDNTVLRERSPERIYSRQSAQPLLEVTPYGPGTPVSRDRDLDDRLARFDAVLDRLEHVAQSVNDLRALSDTLQDRTAGFMLADLADQSRAAQVLGNRSTQSAVSGRAHKPTRRKAAR